MITELAKEEPRYIFLDILLNFMNQLYYEDHTGIIPKDEIDEFFSCKQCHTIGCDCEFEPTEKEPPEIIHQETDAYFPIVIEQEVEAYKKPTED